MCAEARLTWMGFVHPIRKLLLLGILLLCGPSAPATAQQPDYRALGHDHYFNLEYDQAIDAYQRLITAGPQDPLAYNHLATAILFKELLRLGMLETSAFKGDNQFLRQEKPKPDPAVKEEFEAAIFKGREVAEAKLAEDPKDKRSLFALANNHGLHANYSFMIEKAYFGALRAGGRARGYANKLIKQDPDYVDAYLVAGVHESVVGSLPWIVKIMAAIGGIRGSKQKGEQYVTRVAKEGELARHEARSLLSLLLRRESRPLEAAAVLEGLLRDFPRNYLFHTEMAAMYEDAGEIEKALAVFRSVRRKVNTNEDRFARMPRRNVEALDRKIKDLETRLANPPKSSA